MTEQSLQEVIKIINDYKSELENKCNSYYSNDFTKYIKSLQRKYACDGIILRLLHYYNNMEPVEDYD